MSDGGIATNILATPVTSSDGTGTANPNANSGNNMNTLPAGSFSIKSSALHCESNSALLYFSASGGNPGLASGTNNVTIQELAALGTCASVLASTQTININEVTTVGTVAALFPYMSGANAIGSSPAHSPALTSAFDVANQYTNFQTGAAPGPALQSGFSASTPDLYALANVMATCVKAAGARAGDGTPCGTLFSLAKSTDGTIAPTDIASALLNIRLNPTRNIASIFDLQASASPYGPTNQHPPADYTLPITSTLTADPHFSLSSGEYSAVQSVTISHADTAASIRYTTDGTVPGPSSTLYTSQINITQTITVKAIAIDGNARSGVASATYTLSNLPSTVSLSSVKSIAGSSSPLPLIASSIATGSTVTFAAANGAAGTFSPTLCSIAGGSCSITFTPDKTLAAGTYTGGITASFTATGLFASASASSTITLEAVPAPTPLFATGLAAYYRFDECYKDSANCGTSYTSISDYSGNKNAALAPGGALNPTLTSQGLAFSLTQQQYLVLPAAINGARVIQLWVDFSATNENLDGGSTIYSILLGNASKNSTLAISSAWQRPYNGNNYSKAGGISMIAGGLYTTQAADLFSGDHLITLYFGTDELSDPDHIYIDQQEVSAYAYKGASAGRVNGTNTIWIGSDVNQCGGCNFRGFIRAAAIYTSITGGSAEAMFAHLKQNYQAIRSQVQSTGVTFAPLTSTSTLSQITCVGDSITMQPGASTANSYCSSAVGGALLDDPTLSNPNNAALGGMQCAEILADRPVREEQYFAPKASQNLATLFCGTNEFNAGSPGIKAEQVWGSIKTWALQKRAIGWKIGVSTMIDRGNTGNTAGYTGQSYQYWKGQLNALIRANAYQYFDWLWDTAADPMLGADGAATNVINFPDFTHPSTAAMARIGIYWANGINQFNGSTLQACDAKIIISAAYSSVAADGCKQFDTMSTAIVDTLPSAVGFTNRVIHVCNVTKIGTNVLTLSAYPGQYISVPATTAITVPGGKCQALQGSLITPANPISYWNQIN